MLHDIGELWRQAPFLLGPHDRAGAEGDLAIIDDLGGEIGDVHQNVALAAFGVEPPLALKGDHDRLQTFLNAHVDLLDGFSTRNAIIVQTVIDLELLHRCHDLTAVSLRVGAIQIIHCDQPVAQRDDGIA